jgi:anti-sigma B factor antagonist
MRGDMTTGTVMVTNDRAGTWLVALAGEHDLATAPLLERRTRDVWSRCTRVVVDLSAATFIECTVVNWLLRARRTVESSGAKVAVIVEAPSGGCASRVFDVIGLRDILTCYPERETLLAQRVSSAIAGRATARALPRLDEGGPGVDDRRQHGEPRRRLQ